MIINITSAWLLSGGHHCDRHDHGHEDNDHHEQGPADRDNNMRAAIIQVMANQYGGLAAAASALGFPSVQALQNAIQAWCKE